MKFLIIGIFFVIVFSCFSSQAVIWDTTPVVVKMKKKQCYLADSFYVGKNGQCHTVCPNREKKDGWCALKQCPADKPLKNGVGGCHACAQAEVVFMGHDLACESVCPNRTRTYQGICLLKQCPADKPLRDLRGSCFGCDALQVVTLENEEDCKELCPTRKIGNSWHGCVLKECPKNFPLVDDLGGCHDCSADPRDVSQIPQNCGVCHFFKMFDKFCYKHEPRFSM